jgi:hypothetical protein
MTTRRKIDRATIGAELRKKYRTPREAIRALGLDERLLDVRLAYDGARPMKPTRLEYLTLTRTAAAINPLLAMDAKVDYGPIFKGLNTSNFKARKPTLLSDVRKAIKGKTIAKDASVEHLANLLDSLEHVKEPKSLDESVSAPQHKAMEAAAHGQSTLGIPKDVGKEFAEADKGKTFGDMVRDWAAGKDWSTGLSEDDFENLEKMHGDSMPENALDESEEERERKEREKKEAEDKKAKDEAEAKEREEKGKEKGAMDTKNFVTVDAMEKTVKAAVATERRNAREAAEAREFVRPYVGELPIALDSAEGIYRAAAKALNVEDADQIHASALKTIIKTCGRPAGARPGEGFERNFATDAALGDADSFGAMFPEASRIKAA